MEQKRFIKNAVVVLLCGFAAFVGCNKPGTKDAASETTAVSQSQTKPSELQVILGQMASPDRETQSKVLKRGGSYQVKPSDKVHIPQIIALLERDDIKDSNVKQVALYILGQFGKDAAPALPALKKCLKSHDKLVRCFAQEVIDNIENPKANDQTQPIGPAAEK